MRLIFFAVFFLISLTLSGQDLLKGQVQDAETGEPLPFATIRFSPNKGVVSDQEGRFSLVLGEGDRLELEVSYVGYETRRIRLQSDTTDFLLIRLKSAEQSLREVVVFPGENPAHRIIRKAVARREKNNPLNLPSFSYKSYNQFYMSLEALADSTNGKEVKPDSLSPLQQLADTSYLFFNESISRHELREGTEQRIVLASRTAGVKSLIFTTVATDLQPFAFYEDYITLLEQDYLNPLTPNSWKRYHFELTDSLVTSSDTTFIITFEPEKGRNFRGLRGMLYISSDAYALRNVIAESGDRHSVLSLKIRQQYRKQQGHWFPSALFATLHFSRFQADGMGMQARVETRLMEVEIGERELAASSPYQLQFASDAGEKDSLYWASERTEKLSPKAINTFRRMEKGGQGKIFDAMASVFEVLMTNRLPVGRLDIKVDDLIKYNLYEGWRPGLGLVTNPRFSRRIGLGAYAGWGFKDRALKYSTQLKLLLHPSAGWYFKGTYLQELREPGAIGLLKGSTFADLNSSDLRNWYLQRLDSIRGLRLETAAFLPFFPRLQLGLGVDFLEINPTYAYGFSLPSELLAKHQYKLTELSGSLIYRHAKRTMLWKGRELLLGFQLPLVALRYHQGIKAAGSELAYHRVELLAEGRKRWRGFGSSLLQLMGGWSSGSLPYHRLFSLPGGALGREGMLDIDKSFRTMGIHEFTASVFAAGWFQQNLGRIKTGFAWSRPDFWLAQHSAWGKLEQPGRQQEINLRAPERGFHEAGLQIYDLLRINYLNVAYIGLGGSIYYRYGAYAFPDWKENLFFQMLFRFSFD